MRTLQQITDAARRNEPVSEYKKFKIAKLYNMGAYISFQVKKVSL